jgi:ribose transport system ATP-binding protein
LPDPILRLTGIEKTYPGVKSLDKVDFSVLAGEVHALLGENGAGKSTLTRVMNGATTPDAGSIIYRGDPVVWRSPGRARELGVHTIYQETALFPELTVAENIFGDNQPRGRLGLIDKRERARRAESVLSRLGASIPIQNLVAELSIADQQMVEIAKALVGSPKLLILDEPTAVISGREVDMLFESIRSLRAAGIAIVYISHRLEEIFHIADRLTVLKDGKLVGTHTVAETSRDALIGMMVGRRVADVFPQKAGELSHQPIVLAVEALKSEPRVHGVGIELKAGEILAVAGMIGSGRTELARAIFGATPMQAGTIKIDGVPVTSPSPQKSISLGMGFLTEDRKQEGLFPWLSVGNNIVATILKGISRYGLLDRYGELRIALEQIRNYAISPPSPTARVVTLSGGNQQKVLFSRWSQVAHKILLLDEPTRGIDVGAKVEIYRIIRELANDGIGVLLISSELTEVVGLADRVIVMAEGRVRGSLAGSEITEENIMRMAVVPSKAAESGVSGGVKSRRTDS